MKLIDIYIANVHHPLVWRKPKRWITALIRFFSKSFWNHTALIEVYDNGKMAIVEMNTDGINRHIDWADWSEDKIIAVFKPRIEYDRGKAFYSTYLMVLLKLKYDYRGTLWYQLWFSVAKWLNNKLGTNLKWMGYTDAGKAAQKFYCSEFVAFFWNILTGIWPDWYMKTPADIGNESLEYFDSIYKGRSLEFPPLMRSMNPE